MKGNIGQMMRQAQQMQENVKRAQQEIEQASVTGEASSGLITLELNGKHEVKRLHIDPKLVSEDVEMLEDLICVAFNEAVKKLADLSNQKLSNAMGGVKLPPGMKLPF